jgi:hypothetical protein
MGPAFYNMWMFAVRLDVRKVLGFYAHTDAAPARENAGAKGGV